MIRGVGGKAGGGKTYFFLHCVERELVSTNRWIVTNLTEINVEQFQAYLWEKYKDKALNLDLAKRLQIIPKTESRYWFRYRGHFTMPPFQLQPKRERVETPEQLDARMAAYFEEINRRDPSGVAYFLDEAHRHFSALEWAQFAEIGIFYISQHRHLNDTFWFSTQFPEQVNTTLRRSPQDYHLIRNHYVESFGWFKKPGGFFRRSYNFVPESKTQSEDYYDKGTMQLDLNGLAKCYRTRGALGGEVTVAEEKPPTKKLPFWMIPVFAAAGLAVLAVGMWSVPKLVGKVLGSALKGGEAKVAQMVGASNPSPAVREPEPKVTAGTVAQSSPRMYAPDVFVSYYAVKGRSFRIGLSDGRIITDRDRTVTRIDSTGVELRNGERIPIAQPFVKRPVNSAQ